MFDLLLKSSYQDDSNKRSHIGFSQEMMELASIEVYFTHVIWSSAYNCCPGYLYDPATVIANVQHVPELLHAGQARG